jgi:hypothetical protein
MVLDSARTLIIWVCSISFRWQKFQPLHLLGFAFLISGMFIYNNIIFAPLIKKFRERGQTNGANETDPLLRQTVNA